MRTEATDTYRGARHVLSLFCSLPAPWVCPGHALCLGKDTGAQGNDVACPRPRLRTGQSLGWSGGGLSSEHAFTAIKQTTSKNCFEPFCLPDTQNGYPFGKLRLAHLDYSNMYVSDVFYRSSIRFDVRTARNVSVDGLSQQSPPYLT